MSGTALLPTQIRKHSDSAMFIRWSNGEETIVSYSELRFHCRCAVCVDEWTRERRLTREQVRKDIRPRHVESVGRYAVQIDWNDGHRTGIYTFEFLYAIAKGTADEIDKVKKGATQP